eukprot:8550814-Pyramimonas_sp.AAC.1
MEVGIKPRKIPQHVEDGKYNCGDDLRGQGEGTLLPDALVEELESDDDDSLLLILSNGIAGALADIFTFAPTLCYGRNNCVDRLALRGGTGGTSQLALKRKLTSGCHLD